MPSSRSSTSRWPSHRRRADHLGRFLGRFLGRSLALLLAATATACRSETRPKAAPERFAIGVGAIPGQPGYDAMVRGLELAVERLNESGPTRFRLRLPDRGSVSAVQIAQQLRDDSTVIGVVGHPESGRSLDAIPVYADAEHDGRSAVVAISPTASSPRLSAISPWFFRVAPSDEEVARMTAQWTRDSLGARRAAIIYRNDAYGREWAATFAKTFVRSGAVVITSDPYLAGLTEWDAYAQLLARLKPDVLLFPGDAGDAVAMIRALRDARVTVPFIGGDGTQSMRDSSEAKGTRYVAFFDDRRIQTDEGRTFARRYADTFKQPPDMVAAMSYEAALVIGQTVIRGANTRGSLRQALEHLGKNGTPAIEGVIGPIAFHPNHDIAGRSAVITAIGAPPIGLPPIGVPPIGLPRGAR